MNLLMISKELNKLKVKEDYINFLYDPKINNKSLNKKDNDRSNSNIRGKRHIYYKDLENDFSDEINQFLFSPYIKDSFYDQIRNENIMKYKKKKRKINFIDLIKKTNEVKKDKYMYSNVNEMIEKFKFNNEIINKKNNINKQEQVENVNNEKSQIEIDKEMEKIRNNYMNSLNKTKIDDIKVMNKEYKNHNERRNKSFVNNKNKKENIIYKVNLNPFFSFNLLEGGDEPLKRSYDKIQLLNKSNYYNKKEGEMKKRLISVNKDLLMKNKLNNEIIKLEVSNQIKSNLGKRKVIEVNR